MVQSCLTSEKHCQRGVMFKPFQNHVISPVISATIVVAEVSQGKLIESLQMFL